MAESTLHISPYKIHKIVQMGMIVIFLDVIIVIINVHPPMNIPKPRSKLTTKDVKFVIFQF
jgi:hypothetical protein